MPESVHTKTRRIAKNTVLLYIRSLISLLISLWTSRLILRGLGVDDYGLYGVVGGFVSMFSIVTGSLSGAISRFINFSMGKGDKEDMKNTFALSLAIMVILSLIVLVLTETFGIWYIHHKMNIPPGREAAAFWCFQFSVLATISGFLVVSFTASIIAHEKMGVFAYIDVGEVVLKFFIALLMTFSLDNVDKLILYAALLLIIALGKQLFSRVYAMRHFEECRIRWYWDTKKFMEMFAYAGWGFVGKTSGTFAGQGVNMVVNVVFGTAVNAARSLSWTVNHAVQLFVNNFTMAINPQVTQSYAAGDHWYTKELLFRGTKFTYYIMWVMVLPLLLETEFVVKLWLGEFPDHTINFIQLALIANTIGVYHAVLVMGIRATGKVMWYQLSYSLIEFAFFGVVYVLLHNGFSPEWSYICSIIFTGIKAPVMWYLCKRYLGLSIWEITRDIVFPTLLVSVLSAIVPYLIHMTMPAGWLRFLVVFFVSIASAGAVSLFVGCTPAERKMLINLVLEKLNLNKA